MNLSLLDSMALLASQSSFFYAYLGLACGLIVLVIIPVILIVQLKNPFWGILGLVVTGVALPIEFRGPAGVMMGSSFPLAAIICGIWLLKSIAIDRRTVLGSERVVHSLIAFLAIVTISFAFGQYPWFPIDGAPLPAQVAELGLFMLSGCLFLVASCQIVRINQLKCLAWMFLGAGVVTSIFQSVTSLNFIARWTTRPGSVGSLFWTWMVAISASQALFNRRLSHIARIGLAGITGMVLYHGLFQVSSWKSGWLPPIAALGIVVLLRFPRLSFSFGLLSLPIGIFLATQFPGLLMGGEEYSLMTRTEAWKVLWQLIEKSPLFGLGPANYYYYTQNFPLLGWYVRFISHNNYEDLLTQTGFVGLLAFGWFSLEASWLIWRLYRRLPTPDFTQAYVIGTAAGLVGSLVSGMLGDWIIPFYYNAGILGFRSSLLFWIFLGSTLALKRILFGRAEVPVPASNRAYVSEMAMPGSYPSPRPQRQEIASRVLV